MSTSNSSEGRRVLFPSPKELLGNNNQNILRLRVNRVAILQELNVEHILPNLLDKGVIDTVELNLIRAGVSRADCARRLIDIISRKDKETEWYEQFRNGLKNPNTSDLQIKKKYSILVEFLDNTIIQKPKATKFREVDDKGSSNPSTALPKYKVLPEIQPSSQEVAAETLESEDSKKYSDLSHVIKIDSSGFSPDDGCITTVEVDETNGGVSLVKGSLQKWMAMPDNFKSLITIPVELIELLNSCGSADAQKQIQHEQVVVEKLKAAEAVYALRKRDLLPAEFEFCCCSVLTDILTDTIRQSLFVKHFKYLVEDCEIDILGEACRSFSGFVKRQKNANNDSVRVIVTSTALNLAKFLCHCERYLGAQEVLSIFLQYLDSHRSVETLVAKFKACMLLVSIFNTNYDFQNLAIALNEALMLKETIEMLPFGGDSLDCSLLYIEMSKKFKELGSFGPAYGWARKALKCIPNCAGEVQVDILCIASQAYAAKEMALKSLQLAVKAIQLAKLHFGTHHISYVNSLINYCEISHEFFQDLFEIDVARRAAEQAQLVFGIQSTSTNARALRALSSALMGADQLQSREYLESAEQALSIISEIYGDKHPATAQIKHTLATALQWAAVDSSSGSELLARAEHEAAEAKRVYTSCYGPISVRSAKILALLGQIYSKMDRWEEAGEMLASAEQLMCLCLPEDSALVHLMKATLGTFLHISGDPVTAIPLLTDSTCGATEVYLKWVHLAFENLINALRALDRHDEADDVKERLSIYLKDHSQINDITWRRLEEEGTSIDEFVKDFDSWTRKSDLLKQLRQ